MPAEAQQMSAAEVLRALACGGVVFSDEAPLHELRGLVEVGAHGRLALTEVVPVMSRPVRNRTIARAQQIAALLPASSADIAIALGISTYRVRVIALAMGARLSRVPADNNRRLWEAGPDMAKAIAAWPRVSPTKQRKLDRLERSKIAHLLPATVAQIATTLGIDYECARKRVIRSGAVRVGKHPIPGGGRPPAVWGRP